MSSTCVQEGQVRLGSPHGIGSIPSRLALVGRSGHVITARLVAVAPIRGTL